MYEGLGHTLKALVQVTGWSRHHRDLRDLAKNVPDVRHQTVLHRAANSLALFACTQGIGELVRLTALIQRDDPSDYGKIADWVDLDSLCAWERADARMILSLYRTTVIAIARAMCLGRGWPVFELKVIDDSGAEDAYTWNHEDRTEASEVFDPNRLHLPPLRARTAAPFALIPAIAEPIHNALRSLRKNQAKFGGNPPLLFRLLSNLPDNLELHIGNKVTLADEMPTDGIPNGLGVTEGLLRSAKLTTFEFPYFGNTDGCRAEGLSSSFDVYWIPVLLHPDRLARRILERTQRQ